MSPQPDPVPPPSTWAPPTGAPFIAGNVGRFFIGIVSTAVLIIALLFALAATVMPRVAGWPAVSINSESMEPSFGAGDVLLVEPYGAQELKPGSILLFDDPVRPGFMSHRLLAINVDGTLTTKGDANDVADSTRIDPGEVVGVGRLVVPLVGWPSVWLRAGHLVELLIVACAALGLLWAARWGVSAQFDPWLVLVPPTPARRSDDLSDDTSRNPACFS